MAETKIKVCGLTSPAEARFCAGLGVDFIGLNFSPQSPRCINEDRAAEIIGDVRPDFSQTKFIGLFVDQPLDFVQETIDRLQLDGVQLHGNETPDFVRKVRTPFRIKALRVGSNFRLTSSYDCEAILLDTWNSSQAGGTGAIFDWAVAVEMRPHFPRLILAGGLNAGNVGKAVRMVEPFAVDVCSGVEERPGHKSESKVREFIDAVRVNEGRET